MAYTREQMLAAGKKAYNAGDYQAADEIAAMLDSMEPEPTLGDRVADFGASVADSAQTIAGAVAPLPGQAVESVTKGLEEFTSQANGAGTENPITAAANIVRPGLEIVGDVAGAGVDTWMATFGKIPGVKTAIDLIGDTEVVKTGLEYAQKGIDKWDEFADAYPTEAKMMEDVGVLAEVGLPKFKARPLNKTARKVREAGNVQSIEQRRTGIQDMLLPETKVGEGKTYEVGKGPLRRTEYTPDPQEDTIIKTFETIDAIDPGRSVAYNLGKTDEAIDTLRGDTEKILRQNHRVKIDTSDLINDIDASIEDIREIPGYHALRGDAEAIAQDYLVEAKRILTDAKKTPMGLLEARREFDRVVNEGGDVFGSPSQTAKKVAARHIRDMMNQKLLSSIGAKQGDDVYDLLTRQHNLINGKDYLKTKKAGEANNAFARTFDTLKDKGHLPTTILGLMATGSFALGSPVFTGIGAGLLTGAAGLQALKGLKGPKLKKALGSMLTGIDKTMKATQDDAVLGQLKADRITLLELMKTPSDELEVIFSEVPQDGEE